MNHYYFEVGLTTDSFFFFDVYYKLLIKPFYDINLLNSFYANLILHNNNIDNPKSLYYY